MSLYVGVQDQFDQLAGSMGQMIDEIFRSNYVRFRSAKAWEPPVNIYEDDEGLMVCIELTGMSRDQIDVQVSPERLIVRGDRPDPKCPEDTRSRRIHLMEIHHGTFARAIDLPPGLDVDQTRACYRNGYLWIRLPRRET